MYQETYHLYHHQPDPLDLAMIRDEAWLVNNGVNYSIVATMKASTPEAKASPVLLLPAITQPSSCRLSSRRKHHTARNRVKYSHQQSAEVNADVCACGTPLLRFKGH